MTARPPPAALSQPVHPLRRRLVLLWLATLLTVALVLSGAAVLVWMVQDAERAGARAEAALAADAFSAHTADVLASADGLLRAVRWVHQFVGSLPQTEQFIKDLRLEDAAVESLYLVGANGEILLPHDDDGPGITVTDRDYFVFHQNTPGDLMFISPVDSGRMTGRYQFRVTRRITDGDGSFAGVVLATLDPAHFMAYFAALGIGTEDVADLIGTTDRRLRARLPAPPLEKWDLPVQSQVWRHLSTAPVGVFHETSSVDGITRTFVYRKVGELPLVMLVGFSNKDVRDRILARVGWAPPMALLLALLIVALAVVAHSLLGSQARLEMANRRLAALALHDALTGLPGRLLFADRLEGCLLMARRGRERCGLLYIDLDEFKAVNDNAGHDVGDQVLRAVAARMTAVVRAGDTVCRWGGDEFLVLIPRCESPDYLVALGERLLAAISQPIPLGDREWTLAASIGIAISPENGRSAEALRTAADAALLAAKRAGKCRVRLAPPLPN